MNGPLASTLATLEPLTIPRTRELFLKTRSSWTAIFDNGANGGDPVSAVGHLSRRLSCRGLAISCRPHTLTGKGKDAKGIYGSVQFQLFAAEEREFLNYLRTIAAANDGGKWVFAATGDVQPFEQPEHYRSRRVVDRFTAEMLEQYCAALGIRLFDPSFYGPEGLLFVHDDPLPDSHPVLTLAEARQRLGLPN